MSPAKRFWTVATVTEAADGFGIALDGRPVRTPAKAELLLPNRALAEAVRAEWQAQEAEIRPLEMPLTRAANAAIDKVAPQFDAVAAMLAGYAETDLLCHRADHPPALVEEQAAAWDPWLAWADQTLGAPLIGTVGLMPATQPAASKARLGARVRAHSAFELTALHDLVTLSGSLVLGLAVSQGALAAEAAWEASRIDEAWQIRHWGEDAEAAAAAAAKRQDFLQAAALLELL